MDLQLLGLGDYGDFDNMDFGFGDEDSGSDDDEEKAHGPESEESAPNQPDNKDWSKESVVGERHDLAIHDEMTKGSEENHKLDRSTDFYSDNEANQIARHNEVQKIKDRIASQNDLDKDGGMLSYFVISFKTPSEKARFMEAYGFDPMAKYVNGEEFQHRLEFGDDDE